MAEEASSKSPRCREFLGELQKEIPTSLHKRLLQAYRGDDPVQAMEAELAKILIEVLRREA